MTNGAWQPSWDVTEEEEEESEIVEGKEADTSSANLVTSTSFSS